MIAVLKANASQERCDMLITWLKKQGLAVHVSKGENQTVLGLVGDTASVDTDMLSSLDIVEKVTVVSDPFKAAGRKFHPDDSVIEIGDRGVKIGGGNFAVIAGPGCIESPEQLSGITDSVKTSGAGILFGGAFLPRSSPYDFQGLGAEGIQILTAEKKRSGIPVITEIKDIRSLPLFEDVDIIQVGARNTQNFDLLSELGGINKPILLKRGPACTIRELLMSAEYIIARGNDRVILCERGICSFDNAYLRDVLDISAIPLLHKLTHLPVVMDPCHAIRRASMIEPMAKAAVAAGADGLIIEVHNDPVHSRSGATQAITPDRFSEMMKKIQKLREVL